MKKRNALVISYYFPPMGLSGVQRTLKFVKYLPQYNWQPIVLTTDTDEFYAFDETLSEDLEKADIKIYRTGDGKEAKLKKVKSFPSYLIQKAGRAFLQTIYQPDSKRKWLKEALKKGREIIEETPIDAIFATAPPYTDFLAALELSKQYDIPFVVDYRDVWIDNPFHFFATPFHEMYSIKLEKEILYRAEKAIVTSRYTKQLLLKRYGFLSHNEVEIIHQGFDPEDFNGVQAVKPDPNKFVITHSGLFQDDRSPKYFLKAAAQFFKEIPEALKHSELRFIGIMRKKHLSYIKRYGLEKNTLCAGYLPHREVIKHLQESDLLWLMLNDNVRTPGKLYEYFGAAKPILACVPEGIIKSQAESYGASYITGPKDTKAISNELKNIYMAWKSGSLPSPGREFIDSFDRKNLTGNLARVLELAVEI